MNTAEQTQPLEQFMQMTTMVFERTMGKPQKVSKPLGVYARYAAIAESCGAKEFRISGNLEQHQIVVLFGLEEDAEENAKAFLNAIGKPETDEDGNSVIKRSTENVYIAGTKKLHAGVKRRARKVELSQQTTSQDAG